MILIETVANGQSVVILSDVKDALNLINQYSAHIHLFGLYIENEI
jgi:hypothetical protein